MRWGRLLEIVGVNADPYWRRTHAAEAVAAAEDERPCVRGRQR